MTATVYSPRGLDHLVIGVRDLDAAGAFYERLGFRVGSRNRHPWGTENRIVQFPGAFLELVTIGDPGAIPPHAERSFSFGAFVRDALAGQGEGLAMLVLESRDAKADAAEFQAAGIGDFVPFFFERQGKRPDGTAVRVAFELAFAADPRAPECGFFTCQQLEPQNFWNPDFQQHPNGATGLAAAVMLAEEPAAHRAFLTAFTGSAEVMEGNEDYILALPRGRLDVLDPEAARAAYQLEPETTPARFLGFCVGVSDVEAIATRLETAGIPFIRGEERVFIQAQDAMGCLIAFEPA